MVAAASIIHENNVAVSMVSAKKDQHSFQQKQETVLCSPASRRKEESGQRRG